MLVLICFEDDSKEMKHFNNQIKPFYFFFFLILNSFRNEKECYNKTTEIDNISTGVINELRITSLFVLKSMHLRFKCINLQINWDIGTVTDVPLIQVIKIFEFLRKYQMKSYVFSEKNAL